MAREFLVNLPVELQQRIFALLEQEDVASVRLLCKVASQTSSRFFIETLELGLQHQTLQKAWAIIHHGQINKGVRTVTINMMQYDCTPAMSLEIYTGKICSQIKQERDETQDVARKDYLTRTETLLNGPIGRNEQYEEASGIPGLRQMFFRGYYEYCRRSQEQREISARQTHIWVLQEALTLIPRLRHLKIRFTKLPKRNSICEDAAEGRIAYCLDKTVPGSNAYQTYDSPTWHEAAFPIGLDSILHCWTEHGTQMKSLNVQSSSALESFLLKPPSWEVIQKFFGQLDSLSLRLGSDFRGGPNPQDAAVATALRVSLPSMLKQAQSITSLSIFGGYNLLEDHTHLVLEDIFDARTFSRLTRLRLEKICTCVTDLEDISERHGGTLLYLALHDIALHDGIWSEALNHLVRNLTSLEEISLAGLADEEGDHWGWGLVNMDDDEISVLLERLNGWKILDDQCDEEHE